MLLQPILPQTDALGSKEEPAIKTPQWPEPCRLQANDSMPFLLGCSGCLLDSVQIIHCASTLADAWIFCISRYPTDSYLVWSAPSYLASTTMYNTHRVLRFDSRLPCRRSSVQGQQSSVSRPCMEPRNFIWLPVLALSLREKGAGGE